MADLYHYFGNDLSFGSSGDIAVSSNSDETNQRVIRRLITNRGDYIFHLDYGAGIRSKIGQPISQREIQGAIAGQVVRESGVATTPTPQVGVTSDTSGMVVASIKYTDSKTGATQVVTIP